MAGIARRHAAREQARRRALPPVARARYDRWQRVSQMVSLVLFCVLFTFSHAAGAQVDSPDSVNIAAPEVPTVDLPQAPTIEVPAVGSGTGDTTISVNIGDPEKPSNSVLIILAVTLLAVAPSLLIMMTSFTRFVIVLSLTRNALGLQAIPPNQVVVGLAMFLSLFVMGPTLSRMNDEGLQPLLRGEMTQGEAFSAASEPLKEFMLANTRAGELDMMISASGQERPADDQDVSLSTLVPAFVLSELKTAFIIGFIVFVPFLIIDLVVSSVLMALGMMMLPPVFVSLPFKLLLFVMVDGWSLVVESLLKSFR